MSLWAEFLNHQGRLIHKWKHYFPVYQAHFARYVNRPLTFIEIGCGEGGSLQMWKRYFGPHAQIIGIDIRPECAAFAEDQLAIRIGDQADPAFLQTVLDEFGTPDIVLDDGSHMMPHITASFAYLYPNVARDGVYLVEDLHTAYWEEFGGGLRREGSFIELCKHLIDELNAEWSRGALAPTAFMRTTQSMHFYDSIVVFERGRTLQKTSLMNPPLAAPFIPPSDWAKPSG
jgi:SAM-dependent methyltransferase